MDTEDEEAIVLVPAKRKKLTNFDKCVICQTDTGDTLRKPLQSSVQTLIVALEIRNDEVYERLKPDMQRLSDDSELPLLWHSKCYEIFTSKENLRHIQRRRCAISPTPSEVSTTGSIGSSANSGMSRSSRSKSVPTDWTKCLFCKKLTHKKVKSMVAASTFQVCQTIFQAAECKGDKDLLRVLHGVNNDLVAAEAKYHKACYSSYVSKSNLKYQAVNEGKKESVFDAAMGELVAEIEAEIKAGKAFNMTTLLGKYKVILKARGESAEAYTCQRLKHRLQNHFAESIVFNQTFGQSKSELVYSSTISLQDVINAAYQRSASTTPTINPQSKNSTSEESDDRVKLLYRSAKLIKAEISECHGISIRPPNANDFTLSSAKSIIPESLYWLLRWIIANPEIEEGDEFTGSTCRNVDDERRIVMLAQDIIHCASHARTKMPKHASLGMAIRHLTGSKQLVTMLSRMGHCLSYDDVEAMDTSLAKEIVARSELYGVIVPSNISPGIFVQLAGDNNDINEETLDGKRTTHATTLVVYQRGDFGILPQNTTADHSKRSRSFHPTEYKTAREYSAYGKRPDVKEFIGKLKDEWFSITRNLHEAACQMDLAWAISRLCPTKLFEVQINEEASDQQVIPGWAGFNAIVNTTQPVCTKVGYCPMINGSPTEFSTVYTVMNTAAAMMASLGQKECVITFDLAIYIKAKEIQWRLPAEFSDMVIRLGGFHIAMNYLALLGKKYDGSGIEDLLIESGVYGSGTASMLLKGKSYNRGVRAHKLVMEALFRLQWQSFVDHNSSAGVENEAAVTASIEGLRTAVQTTRDVQENLVRVIDEMSPVDRQFNSFKKDAHTKSDMFAFWDDYITMVQLLLQFIRAERMSDWPLHLSSTAALTPYFFAMDRQNYSRWLPVYLADMNRLDETHSAVHEEFLNGNHAISRSTQPFSQVWTDMALEQSINLDSKTKGGIIGLSQKPGALERWFITSHERASMTAALKEMCGLEDRDRVGTHKEVSPKRCKKDEEDVSKLVSVFTSGLMYNPFGLEEADNEGKLALPLTNLATGMVLPKKSSQQLLGDYASGQEQMTAFFQKRLNSSDVSFWNAISQLKIPTFASLTKKSRVKTAKEKLISVTGDRQLFGRLVVAAKTREVNLKELFTFELSTVPYSLAHPDGILRKTVKSVLLAEMEKNVEPIAKRPVPDGEVTVGYLFDAMAMVQMVKTGGASTFGELASKYYSIVTAPLHNKGYQQVDLVFDQYRKESIKGAERLKRGATSALEVKIHSAATPIPKQWSKYIANPTNKINLCNFMVQALCKLGMEKLEVGQKLLLGGGFKDGEKTVIVMRGKMEDVPTLTCDHEEADTRLLLHASYAAREHEVIVIESPDTDVAVLCVSLFSQLGCRELWFKTGVKDKKRFIPIHTAAEKLGPQMCEALPGFHALTGCDSTSSFFGVSKKKALSRLSSSPTFLEAMSRLGNCEPEDVYACCEPFVMSLYTVSSNKNAVGNVNDLRYWLFCQKGHKNEKLPPTQDSLSLHGKRAHYQAMIWRKSLESRQNLPPPTGNGWEVKDGILQPVLMTKDPAPTGLVELTVCHCKTSFCRRADCCCRAEGLACTESCTCMGTEECQNPNNAMEDTLDEDENEDDDVEA